MRGWACGSWSLLSFLPTTIGTPDHTDNSFITIILQDHIGGLKIFYQNQWTQVPPIPGAVVVNAGDFLQVPRPSSRPLYHFNVVCYIIL
ncbi:putative deacetoxyvindoline 4-hydroxylase [Helianthus annuus]|nr:putative deacetoxyvindoline 4-hydroxylase [Helianthus annuus]